MAFDGVNNPDPNLLTEVDGMFEICAQTTSSNAGNSGSLMIFVSSNAFLLGVATIWGVVIALVVT